MNFSVGKAGKRASLGLEMVKKTMSMTAFVDFLMMAILTGVR